LAKLGRLVVPADVGVEVEAGDVVARRWMREIRTQVESDHLGILNQLVVDGTTRVIMVDPEVVDDTPDRSVTVLPVALSVTHTGHRRCRNADSATSPGGVTAELRAPVALARHRLNRQIVRYLRRQARTAT
jgi:hypothetical protein